MSQNSKTLDQQKSLFTKASGLWKVFRFPALYRNKEETCFHVAYLLSRIYKYFPEESPSPVKNALKLRKFQSQCK